MSNPGPAFYMDTSALVELVQSEPETATLAVTLRKSEAALASSELADIELIRAVRRHSPELMKQAEALLGQLFLLPVSGSIRSRARLLLPRSVRSLDAIHIATAIEISPHLESVVSHDRRTIEAIETLGLPVTSPGLS